MSEGKRLTRTTVGPNFNCGTVGNVVLVNWIDRPTKAAALRIETVLEGLLADYPGKVGFLVFIPEGSPAPDAEGRDEFARVMRGHSDRISGSALVLEGTGLRAAASRAVVTAITLIGDVTPTPRVCATVGEAAQHLVRLIDEPGGPGLVAADIDAAIQQLRIAQPLPKK